MSDWLVHLVRLGKIGSHPNADKLDLTQVYGQTVICQKGLYREGDLAVFLPPDSVLPEDPNHPLVKDSGCEPGHCIEAKRLRGIFSNGMLVPADICFTRAELAEIAVGTHVAERLGVKKWEDQGDKLATQTDNERDPGYMPHYTDIEGWAKFRHEGIINPGDEVVITEKIHGANARYCFRDDRLWCGSHHGVKKECVVRNQYDIALERSLWWAVAKEINLADRFKNLFAGNFVANDIQDGKVGRVKMRAAEDVKNILAGKDLTKTVLFGEVYGQVQDLRYGVNNGAKLRVFDTFDGATGCYNDHDVTVAIVEAMGLDLVPELYRGPWKEELESLRNGPSVLYPAHTREGFVMKPVKEGFHYIVGRKIFKFVGEDYKTRKRKK